MSVLTNLRLVSTKRPTGMPPIVRRRNHLLGKLWDQIQLAKAEQEGKVFAPTAFRSVKDSETGKRSQVEISRRIRPWWWTAENGKVCFTVKYGGKHLELAKGKPTVEVGNLSDLVPVLELLKEAVRTGELDSQIEAASASLRMTFTKK